MSNGKTASVEALNELHALIARELTAKIKAGEATAADYTAALKLLKDSNIQAVGVPGSPIGNLASTLPFAGSSADDYAH